MARPPDFHLIVSTSGLAFSTAEWINSTGLREGGSDGEAEWLWPAAGADECIAEGSQDRGTGEGEVEGVGGRSVSEWDGPAETMHTTAGSAARARKKGTALMAGVGRHTPPRRRRGLAFQARLPQVVASRSRQARAPPPRGD